jgi:hypothetical protein
MASDSMPSFASSVASKARSLPRKLVSRLYDVSPTPPELEMLVAFSPTLSDDIAGGMGRNRGWRRTSSWREAWFFYHLTHCWRRVMAGCDRWLPTVRILRVAHFAPRRKPLMSPLLSLTSFPRQCLVVCGCHPRPSPLFCIRARGEYFDKCVFGCELLAARRLTPSAVLVASPSLSPHEQLPRHQCTTLAKLTAGYINDSVVPKNISSCCD